MQRTCRASLFGGRDLALSMIWDYQLMLVLAGLGYIIGITQSKVYAEPEWYEDIQLTIFWIVYLIIFGWKILSRQELHICVAN